MKITRKQGKNPLGVAFAKPLSIEAQVEYRKLTVVEELLQFMKRQRISRSELARRLGVGPSRVTAMLAGTGNLTIDTLVRAGHAVGGRLAADVCALWSKRPLGGHGKPDVSKR